MITYISVGIRWFGTAYFRFLFPILYFLLFLLIFLFFPISGIIFLNFFRICSSYVNGTFIFSKIVVIKGPMNGIFGSIIASFGVFSAGVSLISIPFFLGDIADGRLLHDVEVLSWMDLHFISSKVLTTQSISFNSSRKKVISLLREEIWFFRLWRSSLSFVWAEKLFVFVVLEGEIFADVSMKLTSNGIS